MPFFEKLTLIASEECIESNAIPIEAKKYLEEETVTEALNNAPTIHDDNSEEEDLVLVRWIF